MKFIIIFFLFFLLFAPTAYAAESTPSSAIKEKLQELQAQIASKAAKLKQEINNKLQNKAYVGTVKSKSDTSLSLASATGPKMVTLNQDTEYVSLSKKTKFSLKTLMEEDYIVSLGDIDDTGILTARRVILLPKTKISEKSILWGQIISLSDNQTLNAGKFVIKGKDLKNTTVKINNQTEYRKGNEEVVFNNVKLNDFVIVSGNIDEDQTLTANFLYILPQGGSKVNKIATSSSQIATQSGKTATASTKKK